MTNEEKAKEISQQRCYDRNLQIAVYEDMMQMATWKDEQFKEDIYKFCRFCESKLPKYKACAFRSLGNEYCDFIDDMLKKY